jgi:hypothetical protein
MRRRSNETVFSLKSLSLKNDRRGGRHQAGFLFGGENLMKTLLLATAFVALALTPASAAKMACTSANMAKLVAGMGGEDTPGKIAARKSMAAANSDMSKGNMRGACKHYMSAEKAMAMK